MMTWSTSRVHVLQLGEIGGGVRLFCAFSQRESLPFGLEIWMSDLVSRDADQQAV